MIIEAGQVRSGRGRDRGSAGTGSCPGWAEHRARHAGTAAQRGLLRCAESGQVRSLIEVGQIAMTSSSRAARTRRFTVSSAPSS
jgi:hypothetical protein